MGSAFLEFLSLAIFSFGAPAFIVLAFSYWRQKRGGSFLFLLFTIVCAGAFLSNLIATLVFPDSAVLGFARAFLVSLLPPMMLHLTLRTDPFNVLVRLLWRGSVWVLYAAAAISALAREAGWTDVFDNYPPLILGTTAAIALTNIFLSNAGRPRVETRLRVWTAGIFTALFASAAAAGMSANPLFEIAPDYLLLAFFTTHLYYCERLAFFDVFLRVGMFFLAGAVLVSILLLAVPASREALGGDWSRAWLWAMAIMPVWLLAPFLNRILAGWIDRRAFGRLLSPMDAERTFAHAVHGAMSEAELREIAVRNLESLFNCRAKVAFAGDTSWQASPDDLLAPILTGGVVCLRARDRNIPFLSGDRHLLESLTAMLDFALENVRFRATRQEQIDREKELLALANRAELRALRAQIDPHFLFNALNTVASCIRTRPETADDTLAHLAEIFRYTLHRSHREWVRLTDEVGFVQSYLAVEQARFGDRLQITIQGPSAACVVNIPAMIIQPLVENAIKHGTSRVVGTGRVAMRIVFGDRNFCIDVRDNGPGFPEDFKLEGCGPGHGLGNVAGRLRGYYGDAGTLRWQNSAMGTCVTIEIPLPSKLQCEC